MEYGFHPFPKYLQIRDVISRWLGTQNVGDMLPTEEALSSRFGVSRVTIRKALQTLEDDGVIARRAGVGTWLAKPIEIGADPRMTGPSEDYFGIGVPTQTRMIANGKLAITPEVATALAPLADKEVYQFERVRTLKGEPFLLLCAYLPLTIGRKLAASKPGSKLLIPILRQIWDADLYETHQKIEAANASKRIADLLEVDEGAAILSIRRVFVDSTDTPIMYTNTHFRGDRYYYTVQLPQPQRRKPAPT